ncbi:hypothetical protein OAE64_00030 [bacterium]|nr:hypothetical protein [bacterium]
MRIGILIKDFEQLSNWELRIIENIKNDSNLELILLIKDGRSLKKRYQFKTIISKGVFKIQKYIERRFLFKERHTVKKQAVINYLNKIDTIEVRPQKRNFVDFFDKSQCIVVKQYNLDIILRHNFGIIRGEILNSSKYGIWSFHHGDNKINRGGPPGFWEMVLDHKFIGVTLQKLTPELDGGIVIDKAYFNKHWSYIKTKDLIFEGSVSLLFKNIKNLSKNNIRYRKSKLYYNKLYKHPNIFYVFKYLLAFYSTLSKKIFQLFLSKLFAIRFYKWSLFIGNGDFLNSTLYRVKPVEMPRGEYWADPFIHKFNNELYVFFENFTYKDKKGKISCGKIVDSKIEEVVDVLDLEYHLSFPFLFEEKGSLFMIPETNQNKRLEIYKCLKFPKKWELYSTAFEGEIIADSHVYKENENLWLFLNKAQNSILPIDNELYIYKIDSLKLNKITPHSQNPVIIDSRVARNAGGIFEYNGICYRPSQANIEGIYGRNLNINEIKKINIDEYEEKISEIVKPNFLRNIRSVHHVAVSEKYFVIDAAFKVKI